VGDGGARCVELSQQYVTPMYGAAGFHPMPQSTASSTASRPLLWGGAFVALALGGTLLLWAHYGTTVFFETIRAGFVACFG